MSPSLSQKNRNRMWHFSEQNENISFKEQKYSSLCTHQSWLNVAVIKFLRKISPCCHQYTKSLIPKWLLSMDLPFIFFDLTQIFNETAHCWITHAMLRTSTGWPLREWWLQFSLFSGYETVSESESTYCITAPQIVFWGLLCDFYDLLMFSIWKSTGCEILSLCKVVCLRLFQEIHLLTETVTDPIPWEDGNDRQNVTSRAFIIMVSVLAGSQLMRDSSHKKTVLLLVLSLPVIRLKDVVLKKKMNRIF